MPRFTPLSLNRRLTLSYTPENPYCFPKKKFWEKAINEPLFDITMGRNDGAEICELVGLYILSFLGKVYEIQNVSLYWDDGLACLHKISGPAS